MKQLAIYLILNIVFFLRFNLTFPYNFEFRTTSTWSPLSKTIENKNNNGTCVHVGTIILRKKTPKQKSIKRIILKWSPPKNSKLNTKYFEIENLIASLYRPRYKQQILPIDEFVICDGHWEKDKQCLIFEFDEELILEPINEFCLVITIPKNIKDKLKNGCFKLEERSLPFKINKESAKQNIKIYYDI